MLSAPQGPLYVQSRGRPAVEQKAWETKMQGWELHRQCTPMPVSLNSQVVGQNQQEIPGPPVMLSTARLWVGVWSQGGAL